MGVGEFCWITGSFGLVLGLILREVIVFVIR